MNVYLSQLCLLGRRWHVCLKKENSAANSEDTCLTEVRSLLVIFPW